MQLIYWCIAALMFGGVVAVVAAVVGFVFGRVAQPAEIAALKKAMIETKEAEKLKEARRAILSSMGYDPQTESEADA